MERIASLATDDEGRSAVVGGETEFVAEVVVAVVVVVWLVEVVAAAEGVEEEGRARGEQELAAAAKARV